MAKKTNEQDRLSALLASVTEEMFDDEPQSFSDNSSKVERILLEMVRPDPVQPRRVLPEQLHHKFHDNRLTPSQALRELVQVAQVAARQQGRPFSNVLELLPNAESDDEVSEKLSPEEDILRDLVNLAITIRDDGQVNPLTVVDISQGVTRLYRIETGERRYWAAWLLRDFISGYDSDGMIDCIVIPTERASAFRQAKENTARKGLTAIAMARQAALLLLTIHGYEIPNVSVNNNFYRQALELDLRGKREYTETVLSAMGGISRIHFSRYKSLLRLSDDVWELADRYSIIERKLRYVVALETDEQVELVRQIIDFDLTSKQVKQLVESGSVDDNQPNEDTEISRLAMRFAKSVKDTSKTTGMELAQALLIQERDVEIALARIRTMRSLLDDAETTLIGGQIVTHG